ncbi:MAG: putative periplasmic serine endoprotease DegP-like precursor [Planctomycetes bacterium ADurb.Bin126]|nr:MAG: putative periplasmic serine endoprotease DegP-like precursor [Planctomycetes bacterium ADurb.Bin126]
MDPGRENIMRISRWRLFLRRYLPAAICLVFLAGCQIPQASLYQKLSDSSVAIFTGGRLNGTGWFAAREGLIVTAAHVVWGRKGSLEVVSDRFGRLPAKRIAVDRGSDLALLRVAPRDGGYPALELASAPPEEGEEVFLYGTALFRRRLLLPGRVARAAYRYEYMLESCLRMWYVAGPSPGGTSGGCWVNRHGRVVGNQSACMTLEKSHLGVAHLSTLDDIRRLVTTRTSRTRPFMGCALEEMHERSEEYIARFPPGTRGLVPVCLLKDGPAEKAGLGEWTLITSLDGKLFTDRTAFMDHLWATRRPGEEIILGIQRLEQIKPPSTAPAAAGPASTKPGASRPAATKPATAPAVKYELVPAQVRLKLVSQDEETQ